jgi:iron complex transport system substrate-binding protein
MNVKTILTLLISAAILATFVTGCGLFGGDEHFDSPHDGSQSEPQPFPIFVDDTEIPESPERIVSLSPALTEILFEFGYGDRLVGRSRFCDYPTGVGATVAIEIGSGFSAELERIIRLSPNLLLLSSPIPEIDRMTLQRAGIAAVVIPAPRNLEEFRSVYNLIGVILYGGFVGESKGESVFSAIQQACNNPHAVDLGRFIYVTENMAVATGDTLESSILSRFGENLAEQGRGYVFDLASLVEDGGNQPDVIVLNSTITREELSDHPIFSRLDAVKSGRIIILDNAYFERPSGRIVDLIFDLRIRHEQLS